MRMDKYTKKEIFTAIRDLMIAELANLDKTEKESICNSCVEVCKATHPRASCELYKPKVEASIKTLTSTNPVELRDKINEIIKCLRAKGEA